ncbi:hypothetical protein SZN_33361 [Streptomyces zinciresistens K42]|uniref:Uncharacterized protein n=1 Tax=Streptomyces zinciresistens K42 TaxID=700597 RepID=G2GMC0_9ACTN|nr:hypothetical protein [Streptomyces zinciresistens]EGX55352.1 hypothetical protein SZN_33361 [Streptomyces zinciresistens K42]
MNRSSRLLCLLHAATSAGLAWVSVLQLRHGPLWAASLFAAAGLVPVIAVVRETVIGEQRRLIVELVTRSVRRGDATDAIVRAELDSACCERWWTSLGRAHEATCRRRLPHGSSAA